jgi:hypothetical protein
MRSASWDIEGSVGIHRHDSLGGRIGALPTQRIGLVRSMHSAERELIETRAVNPRS